MTRFASTLTLALALAIALPLSLGACGGGGTTVSTKLITAAEGGTVSLDGEETQIDIPANALAEDTEITLSIGAIADFAPLTNARDHVVVIDPAGTTLAVRANLTIDPGAPELTTDQIITIEQFIDGAWVPVADAGVELGSGGLVHASVGVLAPVAVVVRDAPQGPTGSIAGTVLHIYTEQPLAGITFELRQAQTVLGSAVSDAQGKFGFTAVPVGAYTIHAVVTPDQNCYSDPTDKELTVAQDTEAPIFFGFVPGPCG